MDSLCRNYAAGLSVGQARHLERIKPVLEREYATKYAQIPKMVSMQPYILESSSRSSFQDTFERLPKFSKRIRPMCKVHLANF